MANKSHNPRLPHRDLLVPVQEFRKTLEPYHRLLKVRRQYVRDFGVPKRDKGTG